MLLVDGLSTKFTMPKKPKGMLPLTEAVYENKLHVFDDLARNEPGRAVHKKSTVYPPTWTLDRIISLISGGYPSQDLIDMISGFSGQDHILDGLRGDNYFFGDVIWKPIFERNNHINFKEKEYYNYFIMTKDDITDVVLLNKTVNVGGLNKVARRKTCFQFAASSYRRP